MKDLTVLMPTFNRAGVLAETLEALCAVRTGELSVEIIVIDNASSDKTRQLLREFARRLPLRVLFEPRAGKCNALNRALREPRLGEIVVFTDDDVTPDAAWFEAISATCRRWPEHSVFGGRIDVGWPAAVAKPAWLTDRRIQAVAFSAHHLGERECTYAVGEPFGPNFWVRREALAGLEFRADLGPHPTRRTLGDESEFLRQLRRRGHVPIYSPGARVVHRIEPERTTRTAVYRRAYQSGRGTVHVAGMPESELLERSRIGWHLRIASNVAVSAWQLLGAALEPDENQRFNRLFSGSFTFSKNLEALRWAARHRTCGPAARFCGSAFVQRHAGGCGAQDQLGVAGGQRGAVTARIASTPAVAQNLRESQQRRPGSSVVRSSCVRSAPKALSDLGHQ